MTPNKKAHENYTKQILGTRFYIRRVLSGYAYARNGNVHNPTPRYMWHLILDNKTVDISTKRKTLLDAANSPGAEEAYSA